MRRALKEPAPAVLALAVLWQPELEESFVLGEVESVFGALGGRAPAFDFSQTSYYEREMGKKLRKVFCAVAAGAARDTLVAHKLAAMALEERHLDASGARRINVDPMLVTPENVVVATSKNFPHRVYLGSGVYADLALTRRKGRFEALPWTYSDYSEHLSFFELNRPSFRSPA